MPRKSVVTLTDRPDMTLDVYRGHKTTIQQQSSNKELTDLGLHSLHRLSVSVVRIFKVGMSDQS